VTIVQKSPPLRGLKILSKCTPVNHQPNPLPILQAENIVISLNPNFNTINIMGLYYNGNKIAQPYINGVKYNAYYNGQKLWESKLKLIGNHLSVVYGNNKFVSVGVDVAAYSTDGISWKSVSIPSATWKKVIYANNRFVAIANDGVVYSEDGTDWSSKRILSDAPRDIAYGNGMFVMIPMIFNCIYISTDNLQSWTKKEIEMTSSVNSYTITYGNGKFVTGSLYSTDAINWIETDMPYNSNIKSVIYAGNKFVANVGIYYSSNGINWSTGSGDNMTNLTYGNGMFVGIINYYIMYSSTASSWKKTYLPSYNNYNSIAYGNNKFVIVGNNHSAYSTNATNWTENV
jgi:hypothetical protein